eukprot:2921217-Pyramimonas_sp.AAC.1
MMLRGYIFLKWGVKRILAVSGTGAPVKRSNVTRVYSHAEPIGRRTHGYIPMPKRSDAGHTGIFSQRTNAELSPAPACAPRRLPPTAPCTWQALAAAAPGARAAPARPAVSRRRQ